MSTVAAVSLAIIAATCIIAVSALVIFLIALRRVLVRVEAMLGVAQRALPEMLGEIRAMLTKIDRDILGELARTVTHATAVVGSGVSAVEHVSSTARRVILPQIATVAGLVAAIRESLTWFRPTGAGDGKRR